MAESISFVIPVRNEAESLPELVREVLDICEHQQWQPQVIIVDDGSRDGSFGVISQLAKTHPAVQGIRLRRNFGKSAALHAGFAAAVHPWIVTLDGDLQDVPGEVPGLINIQKEKQADVVVGWKQHREDPWHKVFPSKVFNGMISLLTGLSLHDHNTGLKLLRKEVTKEIALPGEMHRFITVQAMARGFKVVECPVKHRPRRFGKSKYGLSRFLKGFLDLLTVSFSIHFGHRPQHLLGGVGIACLLLGGLFWFSTAVTTSISAWWFRLAGWSSSLLWSGGMLLLVGIVLGTRTLLPQTRQLDYSVAEVTGNI